MQTNEPITDSVSLLASAIDSAMDLLSTIIIFAASWYISHVGSNTQFAFPTGKRKIEPISIIGALDNEFHIKLRLTSFGLSIFSVQRLHASVFLASHDREYTEVVSERPQHRHSAPCWRVLCSTCPRLRLQSNQVRLCPGLYTSWATIAIKSLVWVWCRSYKNSSVKALAQDAENDVGSPYSTSTLFHDDEAHSCSVQVVFNLASLVFPWLGTWFSIPLLDPIGGVLLSLYIVFDWSETLYEQVINLAGHRASSNQHARCIYLVTR